MLDSREKERKRRIVLLRFGFNGEERKKNVFCIILSKRRIQSREDKITVWNIQSWKHSWLASKVRTSARRRCWEREQREEQYRTFLTSLRYQDLPSCSCDSRSLQYSFENIGLYAKLDLENQTRRNSSVSFFSSIVRIFSFLRNRICQKINARKNTFA